MPSPCSAERGVGSPSPSENPSSAPASPILPSALLAMRITGLPARRTRSAKYLSSGVTPTLASKTNSTASAERIAFSVWARIRPSSVAVSPASRPAVSMMVNRKSASRAEPSRRSRVTPGRSSTSASFLPVRRLNSVDLPTFGRPIIARENVMILHIRRVAEHAIAICKVQRSR